MTLSACRCRAWPNWRCPWWAGWLPARPSWRKNTSDQTYHLEPSLFAERPDYLLRVRGMSMRDAGIMDGDLLAVQSARDAHNGQIVVARLGDDVTVKRFHRHKNQIELHAEAGLPHHRCSAGRPVRNRRPRRGPHPQQHAHVAPRPRRRGWRACSRRSAPAEPVVRTLRRRSRPCALRAGHLNPACVQPHYFF